MCLDERRRFFSFASLRLDLPENRRAIVVILRVVFHETESVHIANERLAFGTQQIETTNRLLKEWKVFSTRSSSTHFERQTNFHRDEFFIGAQNHRISNFFAELVAFDFAVESRRFSRFGVRVFCPDGVNFHIGPVRRHELFVDVRAVRSNSIFWGVNAAATADLQRRRG